MLLKGFFDGFTNALFAVKLFRQQFKKVKQLRIDHGLVDLVKVYAIASINRNLRFANEANFPDTARDLYFL
jgi:hypothetical protein